MQLCTETALCLVAHLYQIRHPKNATFSTFCKSISMAFLDKITCLNPFKFFLHIDTKNSKNVLTFKPKSNNEIFQK